MCQQLSVEEREAGDRRFRAILELASLDKTDLDLALRRILSTDAEVLDVERVNCWVMENQARSFRCIAGYTKSTGTFGSEGSFSSDAYQIYYQAILRDAMIIANDVSVDPRTQSMVEGYFSPLGIVALLDVPVWVGGRLWGVVCHEHVGPPRRWTDSERDFALSMGHIVSMAVEAKEKESFEQQVRLSELFVGVLGHDIRNPLSVIGHSAQHLLENLEDEPLNKVAGRILSATHRIDRMVDQLLDFTRIRLAGGMPVNRVTTDIADLTRGVIEEMAVSHPGRDIEIHIAGDTVGWWDGDRLWQLIANLLGNALEHSTTGAVVLISLDGEDPREVVLEVSNPGSIPNTEAPAIFEPFAMAKEESPRRGLGLGLFISREVVLAHGGRIELESTPEQTAFVVHLPR